MMLAKSGHMEMVISGICVISPKRELIRQETARIYFSEFSAEDADRIVQMGEWQGKSGGISVEGKSSIVIDRIEGNFWNIVGFPVPTFLKMLAEIL
jgi:septum formation protein